MKKSFLYLACLSFLVVFPGCGGAGSGSSNVAENAKAADIAAYEAAIKAEEELQSSGNAAAPVSK